MNTGFGHDAAVNLRITIIVRLLLVLNLFLLATSSAFAAFGQSGAVCFEGTVNYRVTLPNGAQDITTSNFSVEKNASSWRITTKFIDATAIDSIVTEYDGVEMRTILSPKDGNNQVLIAEQSAVPFARHSNGMPQLWLALIGAKHLSGSTNAISRPIWSHDPNTLKLTNINFRFSALLTEDSNFVREASFYDTGLLLHVKNLQLKTAQRPWPFTNGYLRGRFQLAITTNSSGERLPSAFDYVEYRPKVGAASTNDLMPILNIYGAITNMRYLKHIAFASLSNRVVVQDFRHTNVTPGGVSYLLTNSTKLPATKSAALLKAIDERRAMETRRISRETKERKLASVYYWISAAVVTLVFLLVVKKQNKQATYEK